MSTITTKKAIKLIIKNKEDWSPAEVIYAKMVKKSLKDDQF